MLNPDALRDIKGPIPAAGFPGWLIFLGLILLLLIFLGTFWYSRRRKKRSIAPSLSPLDAALHGLETLKLQEALTGSELKVYYDKLFLIIRNYLNTRIASGIMEMTTAECSEKIRQSGVPWEEAGRPLIDLLIQGDRIKFSGVDSFPEDGKTVLEDARQVIIALDRATGTHSA